MLFQKEQKTVCLSPSEILNQIDTRDRRTILRIANFIFSNKNGELETLETIEQAMKDVARIFKWPPETLSLLYIDRADANSLFFWQDDARAYEKQIKAAVKGKN